MKRVRNPGRRKVSAQPKSAWGQKWQHFRELPLWKKVLLGGGIGLGVLLILAFITLAFYTNSLASKERLMNRNNTGVTLVDRNGKKFYEFYNPTSSNYVELKNISKTAQEAVIAAEDQNFYEHNGFSVKGFGNAVWQNIRPGGLDSGGSTITQQLVKNAILNDQRSFLRKYQELVLALVVEQRYSKDEILEMYMNSVYFGEGYFGVQDAAKGYFGVPAKDLNVAQSSAIMGVLPAPSLYSPTSGDPEAHEKRKQYVLNRMVEEGYIDQAKADQAKNAEISYREQGNESKFKAPHFALMVKEELEKRYGEERVARSGFIVKTSLDLELQKAAEKIVSQHVDSLSYAEAGNGAVVAIDANTGEILALVGSKNYSAEGFGAVNMATAQRQPGSSFKPIVFGTGIEDETITAATILDDSPTDFNGYKPKNYDLNYYGDVTARVALANSRNVPAVEVLQKTGVEDVLNQAQAMGIDTLDKGEDDYGLALALGVGEVKLTELTNAYATFADEGEHDKMQPILSITNKYEDEVYKYQPQDRQVISEQTSYIMSSILSDEAARAQTFGSSLSVPGDNEVAVKTGTTEEYSDSWAVGYTPDIAVGAWVGNNDNSPMQGIAGSVGAGPIWQQVMIEYLNKVPTQKFKVPSGLVTKPICVGTGAVSVLDFEGAQPVYKEYFKPGTVPEKRCNTEKPEPKEEKKPKEDDEEEEEQPEEEEPEEPIEEEEEPVEEEEPPVEPDPGNGASSGNVPPVLSFN